MRQRAARKKKGGGHIVRNTILLFVSIGFFGSGILVLWAGSLKVPDFNSFEERKVAQSTKIYDRTGKILLYDIHQDIKRTVVPFEDISRYIKNATVAIEDAEFYEHKGIKPTAILRAILVNILNVGFSQGGSTITQQVIKNTLLTGDKKISRKLKEWALAIKLERVMDKNGILALYLNEAPYGGNIYGVEEASLSFFGKDARDVTLAEAAYLAALPQAPTYYSPYGNNKDELEKRKNLVLDRMFELGFITKKELSEAYKESVVFMPQEDKGIKAPHFVFYVRSYLEKKYGKDVVEEGGLKVITTLDYDLQKSAEEIVKKFAEENIEKFDASNAGMVATDPKTGQILVMVGSRDYFDNTIDGNFNITIAHRQPGSAFKPFVYATAFTKGYTPDTVVFDLPTQFQTTCDPEGAPLSKQTKPEECYMPVNYDGKYHGPMSLRDALAQSVNIPAIKTLYLAGLRDSLQTAKDFGIDSLGDINQYGLTLVLGGGEVSLLDITNAYGIFGNDGVKNKTVSILSVEDNAGNVLESFSPAPERIIQKQAARYISDVLSDNDARAPAFGQRSYLYFKDREVAVKTGTTNDYRDAWIIGYTPSISVGAWAGNNDNSPMKKKVAGFIVAPMWNAFMQYALNSVPVETFKRPDGSRKDVKPILRGEWRGGETYTIDNISGRLATQYTPTETKSDRVLVDVHSILQWVDKNNPLGDTPKNPDKDPQFRLWEFPVVKWAKENGFKKQGTETIPKEYDNIHTPDSIPNVSIVNPNQNKTYDVNARAEIAIQSSGKYPLMKADFFVNNVLIGSSNRPPFNFSFIPSRVDGIKDNNTIKVIVYDTVFNKKESSVKFNTQ